MCVDCVWIQYFLLWEKLTFRYRLTSYPPHSTWAALLLRSYRGHDNPATQYHHLIIFSLGAQMQPLIFTLTPLYYHILHFIKLSGVISFSTLLLFLGLVKGTLKSFQITVGQALMCFFFKFAHIPVYFVFVYLCLIPWQDQKRLDLKFGTRSLKFIWNR